MCGDIGIYSMGHRYRGFRIMNVFDVFRIANPPIELHPGLGGVGGDIYLISRMVAAFAAPVCHRKIIVRIGSGDVL